MNPTPSASPSRVAVVGVPLPTAVAAMNTLRTQLTGAFIERDAEINALLTALLAGEHVLLLGPWGTAKSALSKALSGALDAANYEVLLTKHTTPEEVFGPWNLPKLKLGAYERITTGRFPEAEIAFLDEIFKSSSAILNGFLTALNERQFDNGGVRQSIPLTMCVAASNELPQDDGLGALFDRFLVRRWTSYVSGRDARKKLLLMRGEPTITAKVSAPELAMLRAARAAVDYTPVVEAMLNIGESLAAEGLEVSDRRWRKVVKLIQSSATLAGRTIANEEDLMPLADSLWDDPEDAAKVFGVVAKQVSPDLQKALQLLDAATDEWKKAGADKLNFADATGLQKGANLNNQLKNILGEIKRLKQVGDVKRACDRVAAMQSDLAKQINKAIAGV